MIDRVSRNAHVDSLDQVMGNTCLTRQPALSLARRAVAAAIWHECPNTLSSKCPQMTVSCPRSRSRDSRTGRRPVGS